MHDPYESCLGCPKPRPCDRNACEGWQFREAKKQARYALVAKIHAATPDHMGVRKMLHTRDRHKQLRGGK